MKLLALLAIIPAALAIPSPMPAPEAYNPFFAPPTALTHSNNPISHGTLNSRRQLSAIQDPVVVGQAKHENRKRSSIRKVKRQSNGSCIPKSTGTGTTVIASTTTATTKAGTTTQGQATTKPTTTSKAGTTTQGQATTKSSTTTAKTTTKPTTTTAKASTTSTSPKPAATNFTVDPDGNGPFKGQATYYDTDVGYGSCGVWHKNWEPTVALSRELMDNWPGYNGLNPNNNPICGQRLQLNYQGKTLIAQVQDTCPSCTKRWIDVSQGIFEYFADTSVGMLGVDGYTPGFTWQWVDKNTPLTVLPH